MPSSTLTKGLIQTMSFAPRVLDLFCGAGGMSLGFKSAGCEIVGGIDNEKWPIETHHQNFPNAEIKLPATDIRAIEPSSLGIAPGHIDILIGGPPCQGFSQVGRAKIRSLGQERDRDKKNQLYKQFIRFIDYFHPPYFVIENVQGMKNFKKEHFLKGVLEELSTGPKPSGYRSHVQYEIEYRVLCAKDYGVPQVRNRLFIIGRRRDCHKLPIRFPDPVSDIVNLKDAISDLPRLRAPILATKSKTYLINGGIHQIDKPKKYRTAPQTKYQQRMRTGCGATVQNHVCRGHNEKDLEIFSRLKQGQKYMDLPLSLRRYRNDIFDDKYRRLSASKPSWTLTAHMQKDCLAYIHPTQTRSLSTREAARIQSFPDSFVFAGPLTKIFRMIGNAVPPILAEQIAIGLVQELCKSNNKQAKQAAGT
ncbi:MAG: DNA cytosine methyltransferase [Cyanobacteria bacterium SZAS-4]|nr:DNA cytosine methyltransferase [Cyanobacteria bacterium SZAS-4]